MRKYTSPSQNQQKLEFYFRNMGKYFGGSFISFLLQSKILFMNIFFSDFLPRRSLVLAATKQHARTATNWEEVHFHI